MNVLDRHKQSKWQKDKSQWTLIVGNYCWQKMQKDLYVVFICLENDKRPEHQEHKKNVKHHGNDREPSI